MKENRKIKVLVIDDSAIFRYAISKQLEEYPDIEVVATAKDSYEARDKVIEFNPDVLTLDIEMPGMNGIEFLKILMSQYPIPTIVISGIDGKCFEAINAGAVGFVDKPKASTMSVFTQELVSKIREASLAKLEKREGNNRDLIQGISISGDVNASENKIKTSGKEIIAIGASMGGVEAISKILRKLPQGLPPIVITQHMPPVFTQKYAERLNKECVINVSEGIDGQEIKGGHAYIAPGALQMGVANRNNKYVLEIKEGEKVSGHCPSVDYLFKSVSKVAQRNAIGIILTGMGSDGACGLLDIKNSGGYTIGQDKESSIVYGMPMVAKNKGAVLKEAPLEEIPNIILNKLK